MEKLDLDITELTEAEKLAIWKVLKRDEDLRKRDEQRINRLKSELQWLRRRGAIQVGSDPMNSCSRCRCELGKIINRGAPCSICRGRICKSCRHYIKDGLQWICIVCHKQLEIEAATGEWMNEFIRRASKRKDKKNFVPPSDIVKELIVRNQPEGGHEQEKEGFKSGSVNLRVRPSSKSMDYHPRQRSIRQNTSTTQVITSSNDINTITSEERSLEKSSPSSRHVSLNDQAVLSSSPKPSEVPVPAPRTCKRSVSEVAAEVLDEVDSSSVVDSSVSTPPGSVAVANRNSTGSSRQKRQAPQPPGASSPILRVQSQQRQPPPPPPPYRSQNSVSGERSDSGISQDNQPSPKSSSRSGGSAHSSSSGALGVGSKGEQASKSSQNESASITGDSVSSDVESEVESTSGVIFRKVALRRKKKPSPKQRPATGIRDGLADNCCGSSGSSDADEDIYNTAKPLLLRSPINTRLSSLSILASPNSSFKSFSKRRVNISSSSSSSTKSSATRYCDRGRGSKFVSSSVVSVSDPNSNLLWVGPKTQVEGLIVSTSKIDSLITNKSETNSKPDNDNEQFWWPTDLNIDDVIIGKGDGNDLKLDRSSENREPENLGRLTSGLSLSLSTVYSPHCQRDDSYGDGKEYSSSWSAEDANLRWSSPEKISTKLITPTQIHVTKCSWEDLRISSPEYEEEDYLLQPNYSGGNVTHAESFSDLFSTGLIGKIVPEGEEYRIVFISSSSSSKSSGLNDLTLEELDDSDCEEGTIDYFTQFSNHDDSTIELSKIDRLEFDIERNRLSPSPPPLPSAPPPPLVTGDCHHSSTVHASHKSPSPTDFFMLEHLYEDSPDSDTPDSATEWKHAGVFVVDEDETDVTDSSCFYSFVRTDSIRSSGERSLSEQCFSNQVFSSTVDDHLLVINIDDKCISNDLIVSSEMSEHEVTLVVDDEEEDCHLSVSFDSGTSISESEIIGGGYIEDALDSSDDECVAWSYDVNLAHGDQEDDATVEEKAVEDGVVVLNFTSESSSVVDGSEASQSDVPETDFGATIESVDSSVNSNVDSSVDSNVDSSVDSNVDSSVDSNVDSSVDCNVDSNADSSVMADFCNNDTVIEIKSTEETDVNEFVDDLSGVESDVNSQEGCVNETDSSCTSLIVNESTNEHVEIIVSDSESREECGQQIVETDLQLNLEIINDKIKTAFCDEISVVPDECIDNSNDVDGSLIGKSNETADVELNEVISTDNTGEADLAVVETNQSAIAIDTRLDGITPEEGSSELDKSDTDSQDTVIEGEAYRRMRQVAIREKLLLANREWDTSSEDAKDSSSADEGGPISKLSEDADGCNDETTSNQEVDGQDSVVDVQAPVVSLHELIAKSRAMSASYKQNSDNPDNERELSLQEMSSSVLEKYFMSSLEHMAPLEWDRNRQRQQTLVRQSSDEVAEDVTEREVSLHSEVSSERSSEDTSEAYDSDRRFEDSSTEGDETYDDDDDDEDSSSTVSSSSDEGSMYLRPVMRAGVRSVDEALMFRQALDMSLHTIMEESCEESESEDRRKPLTGMRNSDPSELQRYFEFTFAGPNVTEGQIQEATNNMIAPALASTGSSNNSSVPYHHPLMPGDRMSRTDSELSYDTLSETESSIFSESENRDDEAEVDDEELARLASSRLEKYFLTGLLGMNVGNYLVKDISEDQIASSSLTNDGKMTANSKQITENRQSKTNSKNRSQSESSTEEETDETSFDAFEKNDGCDTIKRNKRKVDVGNVVNKSSENVSELVVEKEEKVVKTSTDDNENSASGEQMAAKDKELEPGDGVVNVPLNISWNYGDSERSSPPMGGVSRSLMALDWKQQSRDSGFIGSSDDLLQDGNSERISDEDNNATSSTGDKAVNSNVLFSEILATEIGDKNDNLNNEVSKTKSLTEETTVGIALVSSQLPVSTSVSTTVSSSSAAATTASVSGAFGLFRSSSRSTKSGRSVNLYTSDDEAQYIVNQLVNHIAKSMSRSPQLSRAKPPEIEAFESELTKLMQTVPAIEFTVKEIVEELSSTDHYSDSYESSDYTSSDQEGNGGGPMLPLQLPSLPSKGRFEVDLERNDSGRSWRSFGSTGSKNSSIGHRDANDEMMSEETMYIYERFMDSLTKMAEHISEDAKTGVSGSTDEKTGLGASFSGKHSAPSSGKGSPPTAVRIVQHIRTKLTTLMREVQIDRSPSIGSGRSSFHSNTRPIITWNKPGSGSGSAAGDELSISSTSSANFDSEDSPTDTELSMDSDDPMMANLKISDIVSSADLKVSNSSSVTMTSNTSVSGKSGSANTVVNQPSTSFSRSGVVGGTGGDHLTSTGRPLSLMERTPTDDDDESVDGLERWSSDMTIVDDDVRFTSIHKSEPMLLMQSSNSDASISSKTLPTGQSYGLSSHPNPTSHLFRHSRGSMGSLFGSGGGGTGAENRGTNSCKSDWDMWKSVSKGGQTSGQRNLPTKYKSCDPLPSAKSATTPTKSSIATSSTTRDKKKHTFAFMLRQKSGSSVSLRDSPSTQETSSIKQQIQFRSSLYLSNVKPKDELSQPQQQQQQRSSSMHWLFGRNKDNSKKGNVPVTVSGGWSSNPDGISRLGVDVTTAVGVDLSDSESSGHSGSGSGGTTPRNRGNLSSSQPTVNNETSISDEHRSRYSLAPQPRPRSGTSIGITTVEQSSSSKGSSPASGRLGSRKDTSASVSSSSKNSMIVGPESPDAKRGIHSWPEDSGTFTKMANTGPNFITSQRKPFGASQPTPSNRYGATLTPNSAFDDNSEKGSRLGGSGAGSHTGSSDPDNFPEEDIDRLVALHNRSLSSLGVCSESMSSVYSAAGGGHYGNVTVRGEVQFGLSYNYMAGALEVNIKQCRDLAAVDVKRNRSDPYVKVYLLPDKSKGGKRKTRVKKHTLNPMFNEVLKFCVTISELETRTLWLTVWHSDMFGRNEFLGEVTLPMGYEAWEDTSPKWYLLQEKLGSPEEVYSYKGDLVLALKFVPPEVTLKKGRISKGSLYVLVKEARNLMAVSTNGTSDPFCKSYLLPDKGKSHKQKTHVIKRTCNPNWNHTFVYEDVSLEEIRERCLELTVWDYDRLTSNDFLGGVRLSNGAERHHGRKVDWMDSRGEEVTLWQTMLEKPNTWIDGSVLLRPTMDHRQTTW